MSMSLMIDFGMPYNEIHESKKRPTINYGVVSNSS